MKSFHYVGLDVRKKTISYCVREPSGEIVDEGRVDPTRTALTSWTEALPGP